MLPMPCSLNPQPWRRTTAGSASQQGHRSQQDGGSGSTAAAAAVIRGCDGRAAAGQAAVLERPAHNPVDAGKQHVHTPFGTLFAVLGTGSAHWGTAGGLQRRSVQWRGCFLQCKQRLKWAIEAIVTQECSMGHVCTGGHWESPGIPWSASADHMVPSCRHALQSCGFLVFIMQAG